MNFNSETSIMKALDMAHYLGRGKSTIYSDANKGTLTPPIKLGERTSGWPSYEAKAITAARIAGCSDADIRTLVKWLLDFRKEVVCKSDEEIRVEVGLFLATLQRAA